MIEFFQSLGAFELILAATLFTWLMTLIASAVVFLLKKVNSSFLTGSLGFAAGIMIAASFWSLLLPSFELLASKSSLAWLYLSIGFLLGAGFMFLLDKLLPHIHVDGMKNAEGPSTNWHRSTLLVLAVALHNIPEGIALGIAIGSSITQEVDVTPALMLAIGIGIHNIPEGMAITLSLRAEGLTVKKAFFWGQFSGFIEVISALLGAFTVMIIHTILPYALAFAAGAMIYIVIEELIPQSQAKGKSDIPTIGAIIGFTLMMILSKI